MDIERMKATKFHSPRQVLKYTMLWLEIDNGCKFKMQRRGLQAELLRAIITMMEDGWQPTELDCMTLACGERTEQCEFDRYRGFKDFDKLMEEVFEKGAA